MTQRTYSQIHPDDDNTLAVLTYAVRAYPEYRAQRVVVGHTNCPLRAEERAEVNAHLLNGSSIHASTSDQLA